MIRAALRELVVLTDATYRPAEGGLCGSGCVITDRGSGLVLFRGAFALKRIGDSGRAEELALLAGFERSLLYAPELVELRSDAEGALNGKRLGKAIHEACKAGKVLDVRRRKATRQEAAEAHQLAAYAVRRQRLEAPAVSRMPASGDGWRLVLANLAKEAVA